MAYRVDMVEFLIVLVQDGRENDVLPVKCPGRKPLIEHVRPLLTSRLDLQSVEHGQRIVIQLNVGSSVKADWWSPAEHFAVSSSCYQSLYVYIATHKGRGRHCRYTGSNINRNWPCYVYTKSGKRSL